MNFFKIDKCADQNKTLQVEIYLQDYLRDYRMDTH